MSNKNRKTVKKNKKIIKVSQFFGVIYLLVNLFLFWLIYDLGVLPLKYLTIAYSILGLILVILETFLMNKKIKATLKKVAIGISSLFIIIFGIGSYYLYKTNGFFDKFKFKDYQIKTYSVIVLKNNGFEKINDLDNSKIGILDLKDEDYDSALEKLNSKIKIKEKKYDDVLEMANLLLDDEIDAIMVDDNYKKFIEEDNNEFINKTDVIYTIEIKTEKKNIVKKVNVTKEPFNIYISGIDTSGDITSVSRSDVNMIMTINPETNKILLTSIPRDYYVRLHGTTGYKDKLTHSGTYGINMTIETVEDLLGIDINYYIRVNFSTLIKLVDVIGGVDVYSDQSFIPWTNQSIKIPKGTVHMDGAMALAFARERHAYLEGDRHRVQNQQDVLEAILNKIANKSTLVSSYTSLLDTLNGCFETNIDEKTIKSLINYQIRKMPSWNFEKISVNGFDSMNYTYSYAGQQLYVMEPDMNTVEEAKTKIKEALKTKKTEE